MEMKYKLLFSLVILSVCFLKTSAKPSEFTGRRILPRDDDNYDESCEKRQINRNHNIRDESELNNSSELDSCAEEEEEVLESSEPEDNSEISDLIRDILFKIKHNEKKKEEMNFKAEYESNSSNGDCFQDQDDFVPNPIKRRQQPKRAYNSNDDSDFNVEPTRKTINQRRVKTTVKPKPKPKSKPQPKKPIANNDCDTDEFESSLEKKILRRLEEEQSNDDSDFDENVILPKKSNKNYDSDYNVRSKSSLGNKQQFKPKPTQKPTVQFKKAQSNDHNQNVKGRQYPSKNINVPCDSDRNESSEEKRIRPKKSDAVVKKELKNLMKKKQTPNNVKANQDTNCDLPKSAPEKNTKTIIPINMGKKVMPQKVNADKDCNSKQLVQENKKEVVKPKGDKNIYGTQSKKFVQQNNIEKEICTNNGNKSDDSKQPDNIVLLQIYNQIQTTDNKESVIMNRSSEENRDREGRREYDDEGRNRKNPSKSGKDSGRNNRNQGYQQENNSAENRNECDSEYELKNERLDRRLEKEREYEERERYIRLREERARKEERQQMEIRERNEERARILENERNAVRERNEELFIRKSIKQRQDLQERERLLRSREIQENNARNRNNIRRPSPNIRGSNIRASSTNRNAYQACNAPPVIQRNNYEEMNRHEHNESCLNNENRELESRERRIEREEYEERNNREQEYCEERNERNEREREREEEEKAKAEEADKEACEAAKKEKSKFMTEDDNGDKHFKFSMEMDF